MVGYPPYEIAYSSSPWNQLSYLSWQQPISAKQLFLILRDCPNLIGCSASVTVLDANTAAQLRCFPALGLASNLKSLSLFDMETAAMMTAFFKSIRAPSLTWLHYTKRINPHPYDVERTQPPALPHLLENSTAIKKLIFIPIAPYPPHIYKCLRHCPSVTHLVLGGELEPLPDPELGASNIPMGTRTEMPHYFTQNAYDLSTFTVGRENAASSSSTGPFEDILLPNLEVLEAHLLTDFKDEHLLQLIKSRINAAGRGVIPAIKTVNISFARKRKVDIVPEISQYAQAAGIDLEVKLVYPSEMKDDPASVRLSPFFGLPDGSKSEDERLGWERVEVFE